MKTLVLALALFASTFAAAESLEMVTARKAFLRDLKTRVTAMYDLNHVHIQHLLTCIQKMSDEEFRAIGPVDPAHHEPWTNCKDGLAQVKQNTRLRYPLARRALLLSQLVGDEGIDSLIVQLDRHVRMGKNDSVRKLSNQRGIFTTDIFINNPLTTWLSEEELPQAEWTREEILDVIDSRDPDRKDSNFNSIFQQRCTLTNLRPEGLMGFQFCKSTSLRYSEKDNAIYMHYEGSADKNKTLAEIDRARSFFRAEMSQDRKRLEDRYKTWIQGNPYVGLVTSADPPRHEFEHALKVMLERSEKVVAEHTALRKQFKLDTDEEADEPAMLTLMIHNPVSQTVADNPGPELAKVLKLMPMISTTEVREDLINSHFWQEMGRLGIKVGAAVAANTFACWLPVSRPVRAGSVFFSSLGKMGRIAEGTTITTILKLERIAELFNRGKLATFMNKTFSPLCYSVGGFIVNIHFLSEAVDQYNDIYRQVFSSVEEESLMREIEALPDKEREIFWSVLTIPTGTGALKFLRNKIPKMSSALQGFVEAKFAKLQSGGATPPPLPAPAL